MNACNSSAVLLDLDGTLTDPYPGISACIEAALLVQQLPLPEPMELARWIGPPLQHTFVRYCTALGRGDPVRLLRDYRARFDDRGWRENRVYDGIHEALEVMHLRGWTLLLATAKPQVFARRIVGHFGLAARLQAIHGSELDGRRGDKVDLLQHIVVAEALDPARCVMVGDREHDAIAARHHGMAAVGVLWGFGSAAELLAAGAETLVAHPSELPAAVAMQFDRQTCDSSG